MCEAPCQFLFPGRLPCPIAASAGLGHLQARRAAWALPPTPVSASESCGSMCISHCRQAPCHRLASFTRCSRPGCRSAVRGRSGAVALGRAAVLPGALRMRHSAGAQAYS